MTAYVALLRGVNVGCNNMLRMKGLRDLLATLGCEEVATYIQSGNAVFTHGSSSANPFPATARNWRTVSKIRAMLAGLEWS